MDAIRAVTFDAFGTLVDPGRDVLLGIAQRVVDDHLPGVPARGLLERWDAHYFSRIEDAPFLTLAEATRVSLARTLAELHVDADPAPYVDLLQREWGRAKPYSEVPAVLEALSHVPMAIVSNADDGLLRDILARNRLAFDVVVTSETCRAYKPAPTIFEAAVRALRLPPSAILHVGDSLNADVAGAKRLGMSAVWVNRAGEPAPEGAPEPDAAIPDLRGLPALLARPHPP